MSDTTCMGCGSTQRAGTPFCAVCGTEFPRRGVPVQPPEPQLGGGVQQAYGSTAVAAGASAGLVHTGTTENEVVGATQVPWNEPAANPADQAGEPVVYAHVGRRFVAYLLDGLAVGLVFVAVYLIGLLFVELPDGIVTIDDPEQLAALLGPLLTALAVAAVLAAAALVGMLVWEGLTGRTLGNLLMGIRTVRADGAMPIGVGRAVLRYLVVVAGSLALGIGSLVVLLSPLWDPTGRRQGWHDRAGRAVVVDVRRGGPARVATPPVAAATPVPSRPGSPGPAQRPIAAPATPAATSSGGGRAPSVVTHDPYRPSFSPPPPGAAGQGVITGVPGRGHAAEQPPTPATAPVAEPAAQQAPAPAAQQAPAPERAPEPATAVQPSDPAAGRAPGNAPATAPQSPETAPQHGSAELDDDLDRTVLGARHPMPEREELVAPASVAVVLELASGARETVTGLARVGRNPAAGAGESVQLIRVEDPNRSVSKNHADLGVDSAGLWVTDRGSTNGTIVSAPGQPPRVVEPGARLRVPVGSTIHLGDRRIVVHAGQA